MRKKTKKKTAKLTAICLTSALVASALTTPLYASAASFGGKYYPDVSTLEEALELAGEVNLEVAEEGNVLLKNDGSLPLTGREYISIFGVSSSQLVGASGNTNSVGNATGVSARGPIYDSLTNAGFKVNGILADFYAEGNGANDIGNETTQFDSKISNSFAMYNDVGVIVLARNAGEGADANMVISEKEDNKYGTRDSGFEHESLYKAKSYETTVNGRSEAYDEDGDEYKHYLQLTDSEEELIEYVENNFKKVIVVLNTANAMEVYNLREDDKINGILLMGRPGETGHTSVGEILAGLVNPSGKLVDEWNTDFTADPTWANFGYGEQNGSQNLYYYDDNGTAVAAGYNGTVPVYGTHNQQGYYGVDYEEDIYLGYAYWETYYHEFYNSLLASGKTEEAAADEAEKWWEDNVAYAFGYGLSYSEFSLNINSDKLYATGGKNNAVKVDGTLAELMTAENLASSEGNIAEVKTLYVPVEVTNTGNVAGKEVVEIYVTAPYGDEAPLEKSFVTLSGYAKTDILRPGQSQTVYVQVNVQDFASFDYNDANDNAKDNYNGTGYELEAGGYTIRAMETSHYSYKTSKTDRTDAYDELTFELEITVNLELDDFSDERAEALFSEEYGVDGIQESTNENHYLVYNSLRNAELMADGTSAEELLTRSNILTYSPEAPTEGDLTLKKVVVDNWNFWNDFDETTLNDLQSDDWYKTSADTEGWTQGTGVADTETGLYAITLADMMGIELYDDNGNLTDEWNEFMDQLTVDEMKYLVERQNSMWTTSELATIGKRSSTQADSYNDVRTAGGTFLWTDSPTLAATWNTELANKVGLTRGNIEILSGWSGYGGKEMDTHRSPFSGRNAEYLSQDGIQGGYIAAAFTSGMESRGVTCYIKHFALNDMETCRDGMCNNVWVSEQAARQIYFKVFQMAMQEGGASGAMTGFARFCGVPINANNKMLESMVVDEWGWNGFYITDGYSGVSGCTTMQTMLRSYCIPLPLGSSVPNIIGEWDEDLQLYVWSPVTQAEFEADAKLDGDVAPGEESDKITGTSGKIYKVCKEFVISTKDQLETVAGTSVDDVSGNVYNAQGEVVGKVVVTQMGPNTSSAYYILQEGYSYYVAETSYTQWYYLRNTAARILYADANSNDVLNGHVTTSLTEIAESELSVTQGSEVNLSLGLTEETLNGSTAVYTLVGNLPEGLTFSASDGSISGTPKEAGTFTFTVNCVIDNWVNSDYNSGLSKTYTLTVNSAFALATGSDALDSAEVGEEFYARITSDTITAPDGGTIKYTLASGNLEEYGLTLSEDGIISGTPTKSGTIDIVVKIAVSSSSSGGNQGGMPEQGGMPGQGGGNSDSDYTYTATVIIAGETSVTPEPTEALTEEEVKALINEAIAGIDTGSLTEAQVQALIDEALADVDTSSLTEDDVRVLINEALADQNQESGCGSMITGISMIGGLAVMAGALVVVTLVRKRKANKE